MATKASHKNLSGAFSPSQQQDRGSRLSGLLAPGRPPAPAPEAQPEGDEAAEAQPTTVKTQVAPEAPAPVPAVQAVAPAAAAVTTPVRSRPARIPRLKGARVPAASVYVSPETHTRLKATKNKKIKSYADIVQDAFAHIAKEASDRSVSPDTVLVELFSSPAVEDGWLMPSSPTRAKAGTPLTEVRISFSAQQRDWIEDKMAAAKVSTLSEFIARVLDYYLLPTKSSK